MAHERQGSFSVHANGHHVFHPRRTFVGHVMRFKKLSDSCTPPTKAHVADAGWDMYSDEFIAIPPGVRQVVSTGIAIDIPQGYVGLVKPRSGLARNYGLDILGGVIDSGYHGEIKVVLVNHGELTYTAAPGTRIAQIVFQPILMQGMHEVEEFGNKTARGDDGFGSTGTD